MNTQLKRRVFVVSGIIVVVLVVVLAVVASSTGYKTMSVAQALSEEYRDTRVQVSGVVVNDSYVIEGTTLRFAIYDPEGDQSQHLSIEYEGGVSATFGNQVTAICTGTINAEGVLECTELVTKCPSKYETATDALTVSQILGYDSSVVETKHLKITGFVKPASIGSIEAAERFILVDEASGEELPVIFTGALSEDITDNSILVVSGALMETGQFDATEVAIRAN